MYMQYRCLYIFGTTGKGKARHLWYDRKMQSSASLVRREKAKLGILTASRFNQSLTVERDNRSPPKLSLNSCAIRTLGFGIVLAQLYKPTLLISRKNAHRLLLLQCRHRARKYNNDVINSVTCCFIFFRWFVYSQTQSISVRKRYGLSQIESSRVPTISRRDDLKNFQAVNICPIKKKSSLWYSGLLRHTCTLIRITFKRTVMPRLARLRSAEISAQFPDNTKSIIHFGRFSLNFRRAGRYLMTKLSAWTRHYL